MNKELPKNIEAEKCLLGSMFWSRQSLQKGCEEASSDIFYLDSHAKIFEAIRTLYLSDTPVDVTSLTTYLISIQKINEVGGVEYINEIVNSVATGASIDYYINLVSEKYTLRKMIEVATNIVTKATNVENMLRTLLMKQKRISLIFLSLERLVNLGKCKMFLLKLKMIWKCYLEMVVKLKVLLPVSEN